MFFLQKALQKIQNHKVFKVFIIVHYFNGSQQKEVTIYKESNIKIALNYINVKSKMCAVTKGA